MNGDYELLSFWIHQLRRLRCVRYQRRFQSGRDLKEMLIVKKNSEDLHD